MFSAAWFSDLTIWVWPDFHAKMLKFSGVDSAWLWTWVDKTKTDCVLLPLAADFSSWSSAVLPRTELSLLCLPIAYGFQLNPKTYYWKHFLLEAGEMDGLHFKGEIRAVRLICHFCSDLLSFVFRLSCLGLLYSLLLSPSAGLAHQLMSTSTAAFKWTARHRFPFMLWCSDDFQLIRCFADVTTT